MNKYIKIVLAIVLTSMVFSCKKTESTPTPKDYTASIKNKTWWGVLTYTGKTAEYYTVHFSEDNTLVWSMLSGDYAGTWTISNKSIKIKFGGFTAEIYADISDDDSFINITDNTPAYEINNGQLITYPTIALDNTLWKGSIVSTPSTSALQLKFLPNSKVEFTLNNTSYGAFNYTKPASGAAFRFDTGGGFYYFGVFTSATEAKGSGNFTQYPFQLIKQ